MLKDSDAAVPGTVHLVDLDHQMQTKHLSGNDDIVLVPRPSADPEDPLNWTARRKFLSVGMVYLYTLGVGVTTTTQYSVLTQIEQETGISVTALNRGTGLMFLFLGWGNLLWQPLALKYGRRGVYIVSSFLCLFPVIWSAWSRSEGEWYAHRILLGIFAAPIESLPEVSIPDIFFAHERGTYMGFYAFLLFGSNFLAPLLAGWITVGAGWKWAMWFGALLNAATLICIFFGMEETMYFRKSVEGVSQQGERTPPGAGLVEEKKSYSGNGDTEKVAGDGSSAKITSDVSPVFPPPRSYRQKLGLFVRMKDAPSATAMFKMMWRPLPIMLHFPSVTWAGFVYGTCLSWYNVLNATTSPILSGSPYNFSSGLVGTVYISPIIAAALGALWSGWSADKLALWLARRNGGIREPEHRLWALLLSGLLCAGGLILWGVGAARGVMWFGPVVGLGMLAFSVICGAAITLSYVVDCFKEISGETLTSAIIIRNTLGFAVSYGINPWLDAMGTQNCFITVAMVALTCTLTFLPMMVIGKRLRRYSAKKYWEYVESSVVGGH